MIVGTAPGAAVESPPSSQSTLRAEESHPYCGLYCLYAVNKLNGRDVEFRDLLKPEYIGAKEGSSLAELQKAASDLGLYAVPVTRLTTRVLRRCPHPVILHVRKDDAAYNHWELYLGTRQGQARLYDPPRPARLGPFAELASRWDGNGLIVSADRIDLRPLLRPERMRFAALLVLATGAVVLVHRVRRRFPSMIFAGASRHWALGAIQGTVLVAGALAGSVLYHGLAAEGFLVNRAGTASVRRAHLGRLIPKVTAGEVERLLGTGTVFIDARLAADFEAGHLQGALNLPVNADARTRHAAMAGISKDSHLVVYCQSSGCKFAEEVAISLVEEGYSRVAIFREGWVRWLAKHPPSQARPS